MKNTPLQDMLERWAFCTDSFEQGELMSECLELAREEGRDELREQVEAWRVAAESTGNDL